MRGVGNALEVLPTELKPLNERFKTTNIG